MHTYVDQVICLKRDFLLMDLWGHFPKCSVEPRTNRTVSRDHPPSRTGGRADAYN